MRKALVAIVSVCIFRLVNVLRITLTRYLARNQ